MRSVIKNDEELGWVLNYTGNTDKPFPTTEDFQEDIEWIKENIKQMSPSK
jgi:hypothetical protein